MHGDRQSTKPALNMGVSEIHTHSEIFRAGMPHLDIFGLSESFCLSNAGNHHWSLISKLTEKLPTEWTNSQGDRVYASFVYTSVTYFRDFSVSEDDMIRTECAARSLQAPFLITETNYINSNSDIVATVRLMSTFSATNGNSNNKFIKSAIEFHSDSFGATIYDSTRKRCRELRQHDDTGLSKMREHTINPSVDFNAANFMYFANYCQIFKRYECPRLSSTAPVQTREIGYFGNVDPFETVTIFALQDNMSVTSAMVRSSDDKCIARSYCRNYADQSEASLTLPVINAKAG